MAPTPDGLDERTVARDPFDQFRAWFADAQVATDDKAAAMTLATATPDGRPSARVVLLRGVDDGGFVFYTSYASRKAEELAANPLAAAVFSWPELERQVRLEGQVTRVDAAESAAYFATRPRGHRLSAWASPQSEVIPDRAYLEARLAEVESRFAGDGDVPLPPFWGGYRLVPEIVELWTHRDDRLHDRVRYVREGEGWSSERLWP
jgi:pyridoxamine 5'-phosphate oxidase